jgi:hypothetical protein
MEPISRTLQTNVGINTSEEDVYFYGYSPPQAPLQYATSYQRYNYYRDDHYTTSRQQPPPSSHHNDTVREVLYLREEVKSLEKRLQELQKSQSRTRENDQSCYSLPVNTSTLNRLAPHHMPVRQLQHQHHEVYSRNFRQEPGDSHKENPHDLNSNRFITEEQFHQFASEFIQSLMKDEYTWGDDNYQNKKFQQNTNCYSNHQEDCSITSRCFTEVKPDNKVIEDNKLLKHLNFNGLILQAKSQSTQ